MPSVSRTTSRAAAGRRIVHIVERMAPGGIETLVLDMTHGMGGQHVIFSLAGSKPELVAAWPRLAGMNGALEAFDRRPGVHPGLVGRLAGRLRALRPDAVIVHHIGPLIYGGLAAQMARVPVIVHVEHDAWHYASQRRRTVAGLFFKLVRPHRVAVSDEIASKVEGYFSGAKVAVIAPGIDMDRYKPRDRAAARASLGLPQNHPIIGTSGRLVPVKSQATLIGALALLRARAATTSAHVVIVGEGPERAALQARAAALGVAEAVHLLGHRDDLDAVLPAFDVYCLPSLNEGLPRGVLEAQAAGLPVVASAVGALADAVCPASGHLVPPSDARALAGAIAAVLAHPPDPSLPRAFVKSRYALTETLSAFNRLIQRSDSPC